MDLKGLNNVFRFAGYSFYACGSVNDMYVVLVLSVQRLSAFIVLFI